MARFVENEGCSLFCVYRTLHIKAHPLQLAPVLGSIIFYSRKDGISLVIQVNASALPSKSPIYAAHARKIAAGSTVCIGALPVSHTSQPATCDILQVSPLARLIGDWKSIRFPQGYYAHIPDIIRAHSDDRGYYVVQFARLSANTDIHRERITSLNHEAFIYRTASRVCVLIGCNMADSKRVIYLVCLADNVGAPQSIPAKGM